MLGTSPLTIQYLFLMPDNAGLDGLFYASDRRLMELSQFLTVLFGLPRSINEYMNSVPKMSLLNTTIGYHTFSIGFISESNLGETIKHLNNYPLKVLILRENTGENTIRILASWKERPIVLAESTSLVTKLKNLLDSPVLSIKKLDLAGFEVALCDRVDSMMRNHSYVESLIWPEKHIEILRKFSSKVKNRPKSQFPIWPMRKNRIFRATDLIINRNRGHIDFEEVDIESSEDLWVKELASSTYKCLAELTLMHVLALFENNELSDDAVEFYDLDRESLTAILSGDQKKFNQIADSFSKKHYLLQQNNGIVLWCPSINPYYQEKLYTVLNEAYQEITNKRLPKRILRSFLKDTGYLHKFSPDNLFKNDKELFQIYSSMIKEYAQENDLQSNLISFYSLRNNRPLVKTQKLSSEFFGRMRQMQNILLQKVTSSTVRKFYKLWKKLRLDLTCSIPSEFRDLLFSLPDIQIKFFSDLPLEWLEINKTPLMFTRKLSRVPLTSANGLCSHFQITEQPVYLSRDIGKPDVLFIDGVTERDPVKSYAKLVADILRSEGMSSAYNISTHEAESVDELLSLVGEKRPLICIIDAHATYDKDTDVGYLSIGKEQWNPWVVPLPYPPPIMILNSCQTSVVDGTFNTAANGLLANGVRSIVGTLFPISAEIAAYMCVRLLANLDAAISGEVWLGTWSAVVSKTIVFNHYLDYVVQFKNYLVPKKPELVNKMDRFILDYTLKWNADEGIDKKSFEERVFHVVSKVIRDYGLISEFERFMKERGIIPETAFFVSLGSPETIRIFKPGDYNELPDFRLYK